MPKRAVFERSRREISLDASVGVHVLLVVEQSSLESQSRGCAKTPILTVYYYKTIRKEGSKGSKERIHQDHLLFLCQPPYEESLLLFRIHQTYDPTFQAF